MYDTSVRSATASTGRTVLALFAVLSLLMSAFALARPVLADHDPADGPATGVVVTTEEFPGGDPQCPAGSTGIRFNSPEPGDQLSVELADGSTATVHILAAGGSLTFEVDGGLAAIVKVKGGVSSPGTADVNIYDYSGFPGGGIAHDDGLTTPRGQGISHVDFCLVPVDASIIVYKTDQLGNDVQGATFEVWYDGAKVDEGTTGADGIVCFGDLVLDRTYTVIETDAPSGWIKADPDNQQVTAALGTCADRTDGPDATFTNTRVGSLIVLKTDDQDPATALAGAEFTVDGVTQTTGSDGTTCFDGLVAGDPYDVTETTPPDGYRPADPATQEDIVAGAGTCADRTGADPDATFTNALIPGSLIVLKTDDQDPATALSGAVFTVNGVDQTTGDDGTTCFDGLVAGDPYDVTEKTPPAGYDPADPATQTGIIAGEGTCDERADADPDVTFVNSETEEDLGSITINKELEDCESCEAFTPGYWFNNGGGGGVEWADEWLGNNPQDIQGVGVFDSVESVQDYLDWDRSGGDGENGLSATGQLLRHYLALVLNVAFADVNECDLGSLEYEGGTIDEWLAMALEALETNASDEDKESIKDALDAINNSDAGDGTLECSETSGGAHAGVTFELYDSEDNLVDTGTTGEDGSLVLDGDPDGSGLPLGTYTLVETSNDEELECTIVSVSGSDNATLNEDGTVTIELTEGEGNADITITVVNDCEEQNGEEDEFGHISVVKETDEDQPSESFAFSATWDGDGFSLMHGDLEPSGDLLAGEDYTITEELTEAQIAAGWSLEGIECEGTDPANVDVDGASVTITLGADEDVVCTFTNEQAEEGEGELEIIKFFCPVVDENQIFVLGPVTEEPIEGLRIQTLEEEDELPSEDGCQLGAPGEGQDGAEFTIEGDAIDTMIVTTSFEEILTLDLPEGEYTITETRTGLTADFTIVEDGDTAVVVFNYLEEEEGEGRLKIIKFFCDGLEDEVVFTIVDGDAGIGEIDTPDEATGCEPGDAAFTLNDGETDSSQFTLGGDGIRLIPLDEGTYTLTEVVPNSATSGEFDVVEGETTTVVVFNLEGEEGEQGDTVTVSIMKHLCTDVTNVDEFEAVEDAGVAGLPGGEGTLSGLAATVLACPTIVLTGDVPTSGAVSGGQVDFDFSVIDSSGTQVLSTDGDFLAGSLCEVDVDVDVNEDGDKADCLDTSHYMFEVVDGLVVVTETEDPAGSTGLGTLRFTPGSEDETALVNSIDSVETTGVIVLDTTQASETALDDGEIMLHVYNFAVAEGTQGGGGGPKPAEGTKGSQGGPSGGQLPNTSTELGGSMPAILLAVTMLAGLGYGGYRMAEEARRRR